MDDRVVKIYTEEGVEASIYGLGTEVALYFHFYPKMLSSY